MKVEIKDNGVAVTVKHIMCSQPYPEAYLFCIRLRDKYPSYSFGSYHGELFGRIVYFDPPAGKDGGTEVLIIPEDVHEESILGHSSVLDALEKDTLFVLYLKSDLNRNWTELFSNP